MRHREIGFLALLIPVVATAQPIDCDTLSKTKIPFQLTLKNNKNEIIISQVYRSDNLFKVSYNKTLEKVDKFVFQANFPITSPTPLGDIHYTYNIPTNKFWFDQHITTVHVVTNLNGHKSEHDDRYAMADEEDIPVGPCVFRTKHYTVDVANKERVSHSDLWLAPGLNAQIKFKLKQTILASGKTIETNVEAVDLTTDFVPLR